MKNEDDSENGAAAPDPGDDDGERVRSLVRSVMASEEPAPDVLAGFQKKVRERSKGKFYADGWSTSKEPPISTYLVTTLLMLAITVAAYAILAPLAGAPTRVNNSPEPVRILPPR